MTQNNYKIRVKPVTTPPKTPETPQGRDTFQTPNYAVDLLLPFLPKRESYWIWEPAAGNGKIAKRLIEKLAPRISIYSSDIRETEWVPKGNVQNFLENYNPVISAIKQGQEWMIITNPPFSIKEEFIEKCFEYGTPWALLINADYSGKQIEWIKRGCEKIIPTRRIDYITPTGRQGNTSGSQFHSMWLTYKFDIGRTETFVDLPISEKKENI